jgi:hypothetical protein
MESFTAEFEFTEADHFVLVDLDDPLFRALFPDEELHGQRVPVALTKAQSLADRLGALAPAGLKRSAAECLDGACHCWARCADRAWRRFESRVEAQIGKPAGWLRIDCLTPNPRSDFQEQLKFAIGVSPRSARRGRRGRMVYTFDANTRTVLVVGGSVERTWLPIDEHRVALRSTWVSGFDRAAALAWAPHVAQTAVALSANDCEWEFPEPHGATATVTFQKVMEPLGNDPEKHSHFRQLLPDYPDNPRQLAAAVAAASVTAPV